MQQDVRATAVIISMTRSTNSRINEFETPTGSGMYVIKNVRPNPSNDVSKITTEPNKVKAVFCIKLVRMKRIILGPK